MKTLLFFILHAMPIANMTMSSEVDSIDREYRFREAAAIMLRTLGHPDRLSIIQLLSKGEMTMGQVQRELEISQPRASQHLSVMNERGILECRKDGNRRYYSIENPFIWKLFGCFSECSEKVGTGEWVHLLDAFMEVNKNE